MKKALVIIATVACYAGAIVAYVMHTNHMVVENLVALGNFIIFAALLVKYAGPALKKQFKGNADEYAAMVAEAAKLLDDAQKIHDEWSARRAGLEEETARMKADAQRLAEVQAQEIITHARQQAERLVADAERTAITELSLAKDQLRDQLADQVIEKTEQKLHERISPAHQRMLIEEAIKKLEAIRHRTPS